jgi:hypothetical protein
VEVERITVALRPRNDWEAIDLGLRLAQRHGALAYAYWFAASAPWVLAIGAVCIYHQRTLLALALLWWIKPMFERVLVHLFSRLVFDDRPARHEFLRIAMGQPFSAGILGALTYRRFEFARSFNLPVWQLESLSGAARRRRTGVLQLGTGGTAIVLSVLSLGFVILAFVTLTLLIVSLSVQQIMIFDPQALDDFFSAVVQRIQAAGVLWDILIVGIYWLCEGLIAPFYVAAGFSLYLNRRTHLEAWDVELAFRRLVRRRSLTTLAAICVLVPVLSIVGPVAQGQTIDAERERTRSQIRQVVDHPDFGHWETRTRWIPKPSADPDAPDDAPDNQRGGSIATLFASVTEIALWLGLALLAVLIVLYRRRWLPWLKGDRFERAPRESGGGGLLMRADQMPADVPQQVRELWRRGEHRDALSLLYRGALTVLDRRHELRISASDTEGDCERRVQQQLDCAPADYFARIAANWQRLAYGHQAPSAAQVDALCADWHLITSETP